MSVIAAYIVPHPPLIFPEVGRGEENKIKSTVLAYRAVSDEIAGFAPDTVVIVSPHAQMYADYFHISPGQSAAGDMRNYGVAGVNISAEYDTEFAEALTAVCEADGFPAGTLGERDAALDHGTMIPVRFIKEAGFDPVKIVRIGISGLTVEDHYRLGMYIRDISERLDQKTVVIASGDLSHKLLDHGPYGYAPEGPAFDKEITETITSGDFLRFLEMDAAFCEQAGECGHRPIVVMTGALDGLAVSTKLLSYEGPFGVGYGIGAFRVTGSSDDRKFLDRYLSLEKSRAEERHKTESPQVSLARHTVETYVRSHRMFEPPAQSVEAFQKQKAGVFVSIKKQGNLRGCIGTIAPTKENIDLEIRHNAISAASNDPRFDEIEPAELPYLTYSVDVLLPAEKINSAEDLDPKKYGVIVNLGGRRGLLLPDLDGIDDAETQIRIAMQKAGIPERNRDKIELERFEVVRYL
ncbi:MAG: AmmeMemoRadiSam system protein A [Clostridiales Family XIII bacterium]|jgi:AmmeMemoRadiSam system protein A/AmmeMemoRadiSam system protein B|nr:AmmeMemoRadiSam system protein A [Clostridiales Family XIII bacterium]